MSQTPIVMPRKYDVYEIDRLRKACENLFPGGTVEDRLRTYMLNGTTPEELEAVYKQYKEAREANLREEQEYLRSVLVKDDLRRTFKIAPVLDEGERRSYERALRASLRVPY